MHTRLMPIRLMSAALALLMAMFSTTAWSDEDNPRDPKFRINIGAYKLSGISTDLLVYDTTGTAGVGLSFENTLNMPNTADVQRFDGYWRYSERNRIEFSYYGVNRVGFATLSSPVTIGGQPFDGDVTSTSEATILKAIWSHSYIKDEKFDFGIGGGVYINSSKSTLSEVNPAGSTVSADVTVPLPVFSLRGGWNMTSKWSLWVKQDLFLLDLADLSSALTDFTFAIEHQTTKNVGVGFNVNYFTTVASTTVEGRPAELQRRYRGAMIYMTVSI
jgi:hypothetical protein